MAVALDILRVSDEKKEQEQCCYYPRAGTLYFFLLPWLKPNIDYEERFKCGVGSRDISA
jgi:hypothetical protein